MIEFLSQPWPWWVAGPLIGLVVPVLLLFGARKFGISSSLKHLCAAGCGSKKPKFFDYDWRREGLWNLAFVAGLVGGGALAFGVLGAGGETGISAATWSDLAALGIERQAGPAPREVFGWDRLWTWAGGVSLIVGGLALGFGARWGGGCTSGHAITGLANRQWPSLVAVLGFFAGGLAVTHFVLPLLLGGGVDG